MESSSAGESVPNEGPEAVALSMQLDFEEKWYAVPWSYARAQAGWVEARGSLEDVESCWEASSHLMYAHIDSAPKGITVQRKSVVTGVYEDVKLASVHLVAPRRYKRIAMGKDGTPRLVNDFAGQTTIMWLSTANVIPSFADINCDANRILLEHSLRDAFHDRYLHFVPHAALVLVRLACEIKYQEQRLLLAINVPLKRGPPDSNAADNPVRPRFSEFYDELEKIGAVFRLFGTLELEDPIIGRTNRMVESYKVEGVNLDSRRRATIPSRAESRDVPDSEYPVLPPLRVPISTNCLIYAVKDSVEIGPPASFEVYEETRRLQGIIQLLIFFWMLNDDSTEADIRRFVKESRQRVVSDYPGTFWADNINNLCSFTYANLASHISLPANVIDTRTPHPPAHQRAVRHLDEPVRLDDGVTSPKPLPLKAEHLQKYLCDTSYMSNLDVSKPVR